MDDFLDSIFKSIDGREFFYVIAPLYDFVLIYIIYKVSYWILEDYIKGKPEKPSYGLKIWRFVFYGAIAFGFSYVVTQFAPTKKHLFINHYMKICLMFVAPILYALSVLTRDTKMENPKFLAFMRKVNYPHHLERGKEKVIFNVLGWIYAWSMIIIGGGFMLALIGIFLVMLRKFLS
jgi:hypothetical protein